MKQEGKFYATERTEGISTTDLINRSECAGGGESTIALLACTIMSLPCLSMPHRCPRFLPFPLPLLPPAVVRDYDAFVRRNLQRGMSREEMNVDFLKEKQIKLSMALEKGVSGASKRLHKLQGKAEELQTEFLQFFDKTFRRGHRQGLLEGGAAAAGGAGEGSSELHHEGLVSRCKASEGEEWG